MAVFLLENSNRKGISLLYIFERDFPEVFNSNAVAKRIVLEAI